MKQNCIFEPFFSDTWMCWTAWTRCAGKYEFLKHSTAPNKKTCKIQCTSAERPVSAKYHIGIEAHAGFCQN